MGNDAALDRDATRIAAMFDAIAHRYDVLNHLLSAGLDRRWRRRAVDALGLTGCETVVDVCTGTADVALATLGAVPGARRVIGIDFAAEMLRRGRRKTAGARVWLVRGDASRLPVAGGVSEAATVAFGIRNVEDRTAACRELRRVLRPGGRLAILEFGAPRFPGIRLAYRWYFTRVLPRIGRTVSGHGTAYTYLPASVDDFPAPAVFARLLESVGFRDVRAVPLTFGIVYLYTASV
jgi:demethylmenaquinone methyltransferase/2-methoxy-6-polyprenyl-1,4-benzoquinol methylase